MGGDAAIYVDPVNVSKIEEAIIRLCNNTTLQSQLKVSGEMRAKQFSWRKVASETLEVYKKVLCLN